MELEDDLSVHGLTRQLWLLPVVGRQAEAAERKDFSVAGDQDKAFTGCLGSDRKSH